MAVLISCSLLMGMLLAADCLLIDIPLGKSVPLIISDADAEQIKTDLIKMKPREIFELKQIVNSLIIFSSIL